MLSKSAFRVMRLVKKKKFDELDDKDTLSFLEELGYLSVSGAGEEYITPKGEEAYEERVSRIRELLLHSSLTIVAIVISIVSICV